MDDHGTGGDGGGWNDTDPIDYASLLSTRSGLAICQGAIRAGRMGDRVADLGRHLPKDRPALRAVTLWNLHAELKKAAISYRDLVTIIEDTMMVVEGYATASTEQFKEEGPV